MPFPLAAVDDGWPWTWCKCWKPWSTRVCNLLIGLMHAHEIIHVYRKYKSMQISRYHAIAQRTLGKWIFTSGLEASSWVCLWKKVKRDLCSCKWVNWHLTFNQSRSVASLCLIMAFIPDYTNHSHQTGGCFPPLPLLSHIVGLLPLLCRVIVSIPICQGTRGRQLGKLYATKPNTTCQGEKCILRSCI